jgi:hypothetical protein
MTQWEVEIVRLCSKQLEDKSLELLRKERFFKGRIHYDRSVRSRDGVHQTAVPEVHRPDHHWF